MLMDGKVKKEISLLLFQTLIYSTFYYPSSTDILNFKFYQGRGSEGFGGLWGWGGEVKPQPPDFRGKFEHHFLIVYKFRGNSLAFP